MVSLERDAKLRRMCGLAGIVDFERRVDPEQVAQMTALLAHRGPDDFDAWDEDGVALGHRRLSILDLSRDGRQPLADERGRYRLLHNGEIYNYLELRKVLEGYGHHFRTRTDTEVILAAYDQWGKSCVRRFNGMWAFALWDRERRELFCARDRFGIKPLYYSVDGRRLSFASELKAFRADRRPLAANTRLVRDFIEHGLVNHTNETFFQGIHAVPPAHTLTFDQGGLSFARYWELEPRPPCGDPAEAFRDVFFDSVRLRLRSDVPIGTSLSGGLDSSAIACVVDHFMRTEAETALPVGERQQVFTAYFEDRGLDERPYAEEVVRQTAASGHPVTFSSDDLIEELPAIIEAQDEPFRSTSIAAQWFVMREAKKAGIKVMLDGQGGDEALGGYDGYFGFLFGDLLLRGDVRSLASEMSAYRRHRRISQARAVGALLRPFIPAPVQWGARARMRGARALVHPELRAERTALPTFTNTFPDRFRRQLYLVLTRRLPELLRYEDRNSMAHSIEARLPYLDYRLVELMFSLEPRYLIHEGRAKVILREALADLLPARVLGRTDKIGFATPEARWLRGGVGEFAADILQSRASRERSFVNTNVARAHLRRLREGAPQAGFPLWRAVAVELWAQAFLDRCSPPDHGPEGRRNDAAGSRG
jgi:asparagine synthase (glutamine-hydrolysing)